MATARLLKSESGRLLDIGARDRVLRNYLNSAEMTYFSADLSSGHDFTIDLESKLPFEDKEFDFIVALDVLEHVNHFHHAFHEILRCSRKGVIIALPNMSEINHRINFLLSGKLATDKYNLTTDPTDDRHRWLTTYKDYLSYFLSIHREQKLHLKEIVHQIGGGSLRRILGLIACKSGIPVHQLVVTRTIFYLLPVEE